MAAAVPRRILVAALEARATIPNVTTYVRKVGLVLGEDDPVPPPTISADDLRVRPYLVIYPSPGGPGSDERLGGDIVDLATTFQLTCATGDESAIDPFVDIVTDLFDEWRPVLPAPYENVILGRCRLLNDPGPARRDDDESPSRFWTPLIYGLLVNN